MSRNFQLLLNPIMKTVYIAFVCMIVVFPHKINANDEIKSLTKLQTQVQSLDWSRLIPLVTSSPGWPKVPSTFEVSKLHGESRTAAELKIKLAEILCRRIQEKSKSFIADGVNMDVQALNDLTALANRLRQIGGYGNDVIAALSSEIVFYDLSGKLLRSSNAEAITDQLAKIVPEKADWKTRLKLLSQADPFLAVPDKASLIEEAIKKETLVEAFMELGLGLADAGTLYGRRASSYIDMLKGDYVLDLLYSTEMIEKYYLIGLRGTLEYIKSGGDLDDIRNFKTKDFVAVFKRTGASYSIPSLGVRSISPDDIGYLISIHNDPGIKEAFQARLLN